MARIARVIAVYLPQATTSERPLGKPDFIETLEKRLGRILQPKKAGRPQEKID
ncbi:MAG: hypothetical protein ACETVX_05935 [bacterium]